MLHRRPGRKFGGLVKIDDALPDDFGLDGQLPSRRTEHAQAHATVYNAFRYRLDPARIGVSGRTCTRLTARRHRFGTWDYRRNGRAASDQRAAQARCTYKYPSRSDCNHARSCRNLMVCADLKLRAMSSALRGGTPRLLPPVNLLYKGGKDGLPADNRARTNLAMRPRIL